MLTVLIVCLLAANKTHATRAAAMQQDESVRRAKTVVVAHLDPTLPSIPLEEWMTALVGDQGTVRWNPIVCHGSHTHPTADYQVCVWARGATTSKRGASVIVWLGTGRVGHESWGKAHVEDLFVEAANESLTVERLSGLPQMLRTPPGRWPKPDLRISPSDVACKPPSPVAGNRVTCDVTIHNDGGVSARTLLFLGVTPAESDLGRGERWEGGVAANGRTTATLSLDWPEGKAWVVSARVELLTPGAGGYRMLFKEPNTSNNRAYFRIP